STCTSNLQSDHNAVTGKFSLGDTFVDLATWRAQTGADAASFAATPTQLFTDAAGGDLTLRDASPAIDSGMDPGAPQLDVLGTARPQGAGIDIGAYEKCETDGCVRSGPGGGSGSGSGSGDGSGSGSGDGGGDGDNNGSENSDLAGGCSAGGSGATLLVGLTLLIRRRRRFS
ncbi:MAG TPA: choice-of-anchor Q domain-containing protein, partial [Kofleriaceae bacterium]